MRSDATASAMTMTIAPPKPMNPMLILLVRIAV
jgi:hypothetical protein